MSKAVISVEGGKIRVSPDPVRVDRLKKEKVEWTCKEGPFEVEFKGETPFTSRKFNGSKGIPHSSEPCKDDAEKKIYKYWVRVWMLEAGPPIEVDPGVDVWDSGGGDGKLGGGSSSSSDASSSSA